MPGMTQPARRRRTPRPLPPDRPLDDRERRFIAEYRAHASVRQASFAAGISEWMGYRFSRRPDIQAAVAAQTGPLAVETVFAEIEIRAEHVLAETMRVAFCDLKGLYNPDGTPRPLAEIDADTRAGLAFIDTEEHPGSRGMVEVLSLRRHDKFGALEELGRRMGMFD